MSNSERNATVVEDRIVGDALFDMQNPIILVIVICALLSFVCFIMYICIRNRHRKNKSKQNNENSDNDSLRTIQFLTRIAARDEGRESVEMMEMKGLLKYPNLHPYMPEPENR
ncbi:uncharacterized protein NEMAJ01_2143 [Nematocida major]|uniref:uncharacterized protein n=1 Tax=Nematocida major TaxID=1912982 RepID=UPI002008355E|nr:uncharacterized protein NEMAJ01_2143 [Nematocida major]KAH9387247.1 hypothetical protein NEMAJ01_2143 [Nematocida major]